MFESSLMESGGQIKTKSKYWMIGTFVFNGAILATMILIPLLYPEALPKTAMTAMLTAPHLRHPHPRLLLRLRL
jgi:protein TonB